MVSGYVARLGESHPNTVRTATSLAQALLGAKAYDVAITTCKSAWQEAKDVLDCEDTWYRILYNTYSRALQAEGKVEVARALAREARRRGVIT